MSTSKENILKKIREALSNPTPLPFPASEGSATVFHKSNQEPEVEFAEQFTRLQGRFIFCINQQELAFQLSSLVRKQEWQKVFCREQEVLKSMPEYVGQLLHDNIDDCDVAITTCEMLVARTGSIVLSSSQASGRTTSVYAPVHVCIAYTSQIVYDIRDALVAMKEKYGNNLPSMITFATGPSRTADIEKTLVVGVHGPKEVYLLLVDE